MENETKNLADPELNANAAANIEEDSIPSYNLLSWLKSCLLGFIIGVAIIVPGVSGSQTAIIFKLYDKIIYCISNFFKKFVRAIIFLLPIIIGVIVGFALGFFAVKQVIAIAVFVFVALFAGLMIGSLPFITDEIKIEKIKPIHIVIFGISILIPILMSVLSVSLSVDNAKLVDDPKIWLYFVFILIGFLISITQVIPGLSATALLMQLGFFAKLVSSISLTYIKSNPMIIVLFLALLIGFVVGIFICSKIIAIFIRKNKSMTYLSAFGFSCGSIVSMFYNPEIVVVYNNWINGSDSSLVWQVPTGVILFIAGIVLAYLLIRYLRNKKTATC